MARSWLVLGVLLLGACYQGPSEGNPPPQSPPPAVDEVMEHQPSVAAASEWDQYLDGCGWTGLGEKPPRMVVDLVLIPERDHTGLTTETRGDLTSRGALVLLPFATNIVRVETDTFTIPALVTSGEDAIAGAATTVTNYEDFTAHLRVDYIRPYTSEDLQDLEALGAKVFPQVNETTVTILTPNATIDSIRKFGAIADVKAADVYCAIPD